MRTPKIRSSTSIELISSPITKLATSTSLTSTTSSTRKRITKKGGHCEDCKVDFVTSQGTHRRSYAHKKITGKLFKCVHCNKEFAHEAKHKDVCPSTGGPAEMFHCDTCDTSVKQEKVHNKSKGHLKRLADSTLPKVWGKNEDDKLTTYLGTTTGNQIPHVLTTQLVSLFPGFTYNNIEHHRRRLGIVTYLHFTQAQVDAMDAFAAAGRSLPRAKKGTSKYDALSKKIGLTVQQISTFYKTKRGRKV